MKKDKLKELRIVDNFYQTSAFFPMPTILVGTVSENGQTNLGAYSLCFPYYVAGKDYYAMILECRNSSNTAQNLLRTKKCSLNFITDEKGYYKEAVKLIFGKYPSTVEVYSMPLGDTVSVECDFVAL